MNSPSVNIVSSPYSTQIRYVTSFTYCVQHFIANQSITLSVNLYDSDGYVIDVKTIIMSGSDYQLWGLDDDYLLRYICSTLGFTMLTTTTTPIDIPDIPEIPPALDNTMQTTTTQIDTPIPSADPLS